MNIITSFIPSKLDKINKMLVELEADNLRQALEIKALRGLIIELTIESHDLSKKNVHIESKYGTIYQKLKN